MTNDMVFGFAIGFIFVIITVMTARERTVHSVHRHFINGYWDASQAFCDRSGIDSAQLYFNDDKVYILIDDGEQVILNKCVDMSLLPYWWGGCSGDSRWDITFAEPVDPLPQHCELRLDPRRGMIGLFDGETLYLELFKNSKASAGVV